MKKTIVVTGAAGFIGSSLIWALNRRGERRIVAVDILGSDAKWKNLNGLGFSDYVEKDEFLETVASGGLRRFGAIAGVLHMGANSSTTERNVSSLAVNNLGYTKTLCMAALTAGARFVYASSGATYGDGSAGYGDDEPGLDRLRPLNPYGWSKHAFDLWARDRGLLSRIAGMKYFNVYGPNEYHKAEMRSMVLKAFEQVSRTGRLKLFRSHRPDYRDGEQKRDFLYVKDAAEITLWFLDHPRANGVYNVGTGRAETWLSLAEAVFGALGRPVAVDFIDMPGELRDQYQYFTKAETARLSAAGNPGCRWSLSEGVRDYVTNYLVPGERHLEVPERSDGKK